MKVKQLSLSIFAALLIGNVNAQNFKDVVVEEMPGNSNPYVNIDLDVADGRDVVRMGDKVAFCFKVSQPGYVSLWDLGTSGKVSKIYPFREQNNIRRVNANQKECVGNTRFTVTGPQGVENVVLYWTANERGQIEAAQYDNKSEFVSALTSNVRRNNSYNDWATAEVTFEVIGENDSANGVADVGRLAKTTSQYDNVYVLAFGSNVEPLKKTNDDAKLFIEMAKGSFGVSNNNILLFENAYRSDFEKGFDWLRSSVGNNDLVLIFYSGHGTKIPDDNGDEVDGLDEALVPYDLADKNNWNNDKVYIRDDELKQWLSTIKTGAVVTIFDACHSGGLHKSFLSARRKFFTKGSLAAAGAKAINVEGTPRDIVDSGLSNQSGTQYIMLSAANEMQYALELPNKGGIFTYGLLDELRKSGQHRNWKEMFGTLSRNVERGSNGQQTPITVDPGNALKNLELN